MPIRIDYLLPNGTQGFSVYDGQWFTIDEAIRAVKDLCPRIKILSVTTGAL